MSAATVYSSYRIDATHPFDTTGDEWRYEWRIR
jgi:hypothetical protein